MEIGNNLKKLRTSKNMTQKDLAEALNVSYQAVSRWENDEVEPDISTLSKLSEIFGCSVDQIINGVEPKQEETKDDAELAAGLVAAAAVSNKQEVRKCKQCGKVFGNGDTIYHVTNKYPDGTTSVDDLCENCYKPQQQDDVKKEPEKKITGYCDICGKPIYNNEYKTLKKRKSRRTYETKKVCADCFKKHNDKDGYSEYKASDIGNVKIKKNKTRLGHDVKIGLWQLIVGGILGIAAGIINFFVFKNTDIEMVATVFISIGISYGLFAAFYCIFTWSYISEVFINIATKSIHFPGIIFSWDLDGLKFLIAMKILFAVLGFLLGLAVIALAVGVSMFLAFFSFPFILVYNIRNGVE